MTQSKITLKSIEINGNKIEIRDSGEIIVNGVNSKTGKLTGKEKFNWFFFGLSLGAFLVMFFILIAKGA